ncbi:arginyl-tRNA--protein transferase 1 isoform X6 [Eleutherodactylus coqui]|uniref:arginyl-tRNA--protein transferase 1 isoform X6 n=1 Tax=Eleutherodactylus coqui TaxID=57060 RepID=UPI0034628894
MASAGGGALSILEYFGGEDGNRCGYCKSEAGNVSHGMWAHSLTVQDYQDLIDRGWRRSGKYVYKPLMSQTCCPQYTIRLSALNYQPNKSHKKVLKKMQKFLQDGEVCNSTSDGISVEPMDSQADSPVSCNTSFKREISEDELKPLCTEGEDPAAQHREKAMEKITDGETHKDHGDPIDTTTVKTTVYSMPKPGKGADTSKPPRRKAKDIRKERHLQKMLLQKGDQTSQPSAVTPTAAKPKAGGSKSIEEFIDVPDRENVAHRLEVKLVPVSMEDPEFVASFESSAALYAKYQMSVHKDLPYECGPGEFTRFLCDSPLEGQYKPSQLLCPESYSWVPIEKCLPLLESSKYSRFNGNPKEGDKDYLTELSRVRVLHKRTVMPYSIYKKRRKGPSDETVVKQYATLVGQTCAERMLLYRS